MDVFGHRDVDAEIADQLRAEGFPVETIGDVHRVHWTPEVEEAVGDMQDAIAVHGSLHTAAEAGALEIEM